VVPGRTELITTLTEVAQGRPSRADRLERARFELEVAERLAAPAEVEQRVREVHQRLSGTGWGCWSCSPR
jgi:hypothetical protein